MLTLRASIPPDHLNRFGDKPFHSLVSSAAVVSSFGLGVYYWRGPSQKGGQAPGKQAKMLGRR